MIINVLDTVVLEHDLLQHGLLQGDIGVVVHVYQNGVAYEVEFMTGEGETVAVLTLEAENVRGMKEREILHVRELMPA